MWILLQMDLDLLNKEQNSLFSSHLTPFLLVNLGMKLEIVLNREFLLRKAIKVITNFSIVKYRIFSLTNKKRRTAKTWAAQTSRSLCVPDPLQLIIELESANQASCVYLLHRKNREKQING